MTVTVHTEKPTLGLDNDSVSFIAYVNGEKVDCTITGEALKSQFRSPDKPILQVFKENHVLIGAMAEFLINTRPERVDGALVLHSEDIKRFPKN